MGPHPWGVRGLAQGLLQAVGMQNPGWVLCCLSWSLLGTHTHMWTHPPHTYRHKDKWHMHTWTSLYLSEHKRELRPRVVVRHLLWPSPSSGTLAAPLNKLQPHPSSPTG